MSDSEDRAKEALITLTTSAKALQEELDELSARLADVENREKRCSSVAITCEAAIAWVLAFGVTS
jgi:hypothetical protein